MSATKPESAVLSALTAAAAAIPGPTAAAGEVAAGYRFSVYDEADLPAARAASGQASERYRIHTHQLRGESLLASDWTLQGELMVETMSGASPWFVVPAADNTPVQVMSGATIQDERYALYGQAWRDLNAGPRLKLNAGVSRERDYLALSTGVEGEWSLDAQRTTLSAGVGYSADRLRPTEGGSERFPERIEAANKATLSIVGGVSRVLSPQTVVQASISLAHADGFLSDPYKLVFVDGSTRADARPNVRNQAALNLRLRQYLPDWRLALHADYRYFEDSWQVHSDTLELGLIQRLAAGWRWRTDLRWTQQSRAEFYQPFFRAERPDGSYSSDYRLSAFGAVSARLGLDYLSQRLQWSVGVEVYEADARYALRTVNQPSPGLVEFVSLSMALGWTFGRDSALLPSDPVVVRPLGS